MDRSFLHRPWQEIASMLRPVLRRALRQPARAGEAASWLPEMLLSALEIWDQVPTEEQETLLDALTQVIGVVLAHRGRLEKSGRDTWPPHSQDTQP